MLNDLHATCLSEALLKLLKAPTEGTMAYIRSLPAEAMNELCGNRSFQIPGWEIYFVTDHLDGERRIVTADQAVDLREEKRGSVLLFVDTRKAGAGMDGIYSAVREVSEKELLPKAISAADRRFTSRKQKDFAEAAVKQARKIGRTHTISPWREFDFYARCAEDPQSIGKFISLLGLWPILTDEALTTGDLAVAAQVVERILLPSGSLNTPQSRVQSLLLPESDNIRATALEKFLRESSGLRWTEMAERASGFQDLWLNNLKPGFNSQELISIELTEWQSRPDAAPLKWSGLSLNSSHELEFLINDSSKFEIRWKVQPTNLKSGAIEYKVTIVTGSDVELVSRQVSHTEKKEQKCVFTREDFADFDGTEKWQAKVIVHPIDEPSPSETVGNVESPRWKESREFILTFGDKQAATKTSVGKKARALVEEAIKLDSDFFEIACTQPTTEDSQGFINFNVGGKSGRVFRPELIKMVEDNWKQNDFAIGRWTVKARTDGSRAGEPVFIPAERGNYSPEAWKKLEDSTRQLAQRAYNQCGFVGIIYHNNDHAASYVNAWANAIETGYKDFALANTVEVQSLSGDTIGLIVLPSHATRVAWHNAYDELAFHSRFNESLSATETVGTLKSLDGSFVPMLLPAITGEKYFVFGDSLGFYAVAMIQVDEPEPQAMIAQMLRCLSSASGDAIASTVGISLATAIGREIEKYNSLHPQYRTIHINALRAGDGKTVAQALGMSFSNTSEEEQDRRNSAQQGFVLNLFPGHELSNQRLVGRFFAEAAERRRSGVSSGVATDERWMLETFEVGNSTLPRLKWAKRSNPEPNSAAHLSLAFDIFDSTVVPSDETEFPDTRPIEAFGLIPSIVREFTLEPVPTWITTLSPQVDGEKHPLARVLSERLQKIHNSVVRATALNLNAQINRSEKPWAVLKTSLKADQFDFIRNLHERSDWVVSVDRNAGIEYFDAPKELEVYDTYVIDCVPERQDLDTVQLVTSTTKIDEVLQLLEDSLGDMALSQSPRNGRFLLSNLKAISGRLAMRLAERGQGRTEMIALAMFHAGCRKFANDNDWLQLDKGFLVPIDDVRDLLPALISEKNLEAEVEDIDDHSLMRADLVYVRLSKRGALQFTFVEIKYRRLLKSAHEPKLHEHVCNQVANTRKRWIDTYFSPKLTQTQVVLRRKKLARALRFYLDKAGRHLLENSEKSRFSIAIDKLFRSETEISEDLISDRGYIFCPEFQGTIEVIKEEANCEIRIFGANTLPDLPYSYAEKSLSTETHEAAAVVVGAESATESPKELLANDGDREIEADIENEGVSGLTTLISGEPNEQPEQLTQLRDRAAETDAAETDDTPVSKYTNEVIVRLGTTLASETPVEWKVAITGNPHMLIAGLPGMGKTTCLINICNQLNLAGITPIVFSYHDDIETKLAERLGNLSYVDIDRGLGFNPLRIVTPNVHAWLDNIGKLRDIFAAIYPDLGDIQLNEIREAIKQSYVDVGYGNVDAAADRLPTPKFRRFYEILRSKSKPNTGIIARLEELNDYDFFDSSTERGSMLELHEPVIVRLHTTQNEVLQNAMASFVLLNIYQNMLLRGSQPGLTHAVIFDEAHRAGKLKLIPTMAKECRKFGISMIVASQEAKDFSDSLYAAIANYLVLRVTETDAKALAKNVVHSAEANSVAGRLKSLEKYTAMFFTEGRRPSTLHLDS